MSYDSVVLAESSLVNYWKLGESSGSSTVADSKGSATLTNSLTTLGAAGLLPSDGQTSATFNGSSDPSLTSALYGANTVANWDYTQPFSVEFSVRPNFARASGTLAQYAVVGKGTGPSASAWYAGLMFDSFIPGATADIAVPFGALFGSDGTGAFAQGDSADLANATNYLILITFDGTGNSSGLKFYVNGAAAANRVSPFTTTPAASTIVNSGDFALGGVGSGPGFFGLPFAGGLERVSLYSAALSSTAAGDHYAAWSSAPTLAAGTLAFVSSGPSGIAFSAAAGSGGTGTINQNLQRSTTSGSGFSDLSGKTTITPTDTTASTGTLYYYRERYTDSAGTPATVYSGEVTAQVYTGGALTGGGGSVVKSGQRRRGR